MIKEIKHKSFLRAYLKGKIAANIGLDKDSCPYQDKRNKKGGPTWSKVFRRYWFDGFNDNAPEGFKLLGRASCHMRSQSFLKGEKRGIKNSENNKI